MVWPKNEKKKGFGFCHMLFLCLLMTQKKMIMWLVYFSSLLGSVGLEIPTLWFFQGSKKGYSFIALPINNRKLTDAVSI